MTLGKESAVLIPNTTSDSHSYSYNSESAVSHNFILCFSFTRYKMQPQCSVLLLMYGVSTINALRYFVTNVAKNTNWKINCAAYTVCLKVTHPVDTTHTEDQQLQVLVYNEAITKLCHI